MAITRNHALLLAIIAELFAMLRGRLHDVGSGSSPLSVGCADTVPGRATGLARPSDPQRGEVKAAQVRLTSPRERGEGPQDAKPTERGLPLDQGNANSNTSTTFTLPRALYAAILLILRPCESAIRRLIVIAARGIVIKFRPSRPLPAFFASCASATGSHTPSFQLIDPLKHFDQEAWENELNAAGSMHEVLTSNASRAHHQATLAATPINATLLFNRLRAMRHALNDLPRQARRLARWRARRDEILSSKAPYKSTRISPFRPGPPPGYRRKEIHPVDSILKDVHYFAVEAFGSDTS